MAGLKPVTELPRGVYQAVCLSCNAETTVMWKILANAPTTCATCNQPYYAQQGWPEIVVPNIHKAVNQNHYDNVYRLFYEKPLTDRDTFVRLKVDQALRQTHIRDEAHRQQVIKEATKDALNESKLHRKLNSP